MKKIALSVMTAVCVSSFAVAGGDLKEVEPAVVPVVPMEEESKSGFYAGLGISAVSTRDGSLNITSVEEGQDRTMDVLLMAGYEFNPYMAVEGRYMTSVAYEDVLERSSWGLYVKPQYPVNEDFSVYALLGYGGLKADGIKGELVSVDDTAFQWGLGASYNVSENVSIFGDYVSVAKEMGSDIFIGVPLVDVNSDAFTLGLTYKF